MTGSRLKRGKKARYALYNGKEIEGLYLTYNKDKSVRNYYYLDANKRQVSCTADIVEAVRRFREYQNQNSTVELLSNHSPVSIDTPENFDKSIDTERIVSLTIHKDGTVSKQDINSYPKEVIVRKFVELLKEDQYGIAELAGIPQLAHLESITPLPKSLTLKELIEDFKIRTDIAHNYIKDVKNYWQSFSNIVQKIEVRKISFNDIKKYNDEIHKLSKEKAITNKHRYIKNRFDAVKAVILYAKKRNEYKKDLITLLGHLEQLRYITKYKKNIPVVVKPNQFQDMLSNADNPLTRCLLLLGLNCAMRYEDIINLRKSEIDFDNKYLQRQRTKTGIIHSAILWTETIKALKEYMKEYPNDSEFVFTTKFNNKYVEKYLRTIYFDSVRIDTITHKHLRNSVSSIANRLGCNPNGIKIIMGHNISSVDNSYNERHSEATRQVCNEVYKYYFEK